MYLKPKLGGDPINDSKTFLLNLHAHPPLSYIREHCNFFYDCIHDDLKFQSIKPTTFMKSKKCLFKLMCFKLGRRALYLN
jgi:hypothetical protein